MPGWTGQPALNCAGKKVCRLRHFRPWAARHWVRLGGQLEAEFAKCAGGEAENENRKPRHEQCAFAVFEPDE
jgi:hypothetical protein